MGDSSKINNIYLSPDLNILPKSGEVKDLGILMSENCEFDNHIATVLSKEMLQTMWLDLANLFHAFQASPVNFVQVISDTLFGLWLPIMVPFPSEKYKCP